MLAALGLIAAVFIFIDSFFGLTMNKLGGKALLLHAGIFALAIPLVFVERSRGVAPFRGRPRWVTRGMQVVFVFFLAVFFTFIVLSHSAAPDIVNGEYVLNSHGRIVSYISEKEYLLLKAWELRLFATGWIVFYYSLMLHWWFPRQDEWTVLMPDQK